MLRRLLVATVVLIVLAGFVALLHHAAHCENQQGDCTICKLAGALVLLGLAWLVILQATSGRVFAVLNSIRLMANAAGRQAVRAPPAISFFY